MSEKHSRRRRGPTERERRRAARGASSPRDAALRGAGLGLVAYGAWDLTNWAVIANSPGRLVPVDMACGITLTAAVAFIGHRAS